jgi:cob(I)alamin adenosyltransferase
MVYLSRIYTKTGDDGGTALGDGARVRKDHLRVEAYGAVDELNAALGLLLAQAGDFAERSFVLGVCNDLFDLGADLCMPSPTDGAADSALRMTPEQVEKLERGIDRHNDKLQPLKSFILRGGTPSAAWCHFACTVCRRAERRVAALAGSEAVNPQALVYLNRLSDYLFVLARTLNDGGRADVLWTPGGARPT